MLSLFRDKSAEHGNFEERLFQSHEDDLGDR